MISLDCETTGGDFRHGAKPFLVTTCTEDEEITFFEWDVDPTTREPIIPLEDMLAIETLICNNELVLQNPKFDVGAIGAIPAMREHCGMPDNWPWHDTDDTLTAAHLLASNQAKDLTTLALVYLGENILPYEEAVQAACNEARRIARKLGTKVTMDLFTGLSSGGPWMIAKKGLACMPSAKETVWKFDMWLPRAVAVELKYPQPDPDCEHMYVGNVCARCGGHHWWTVTSEYANADSSVTIKLWPVMYAKLQERGLIPLYREKMKNLSVLFEMERRGTTVIQSELDAMRCKYREEIAEKNAKCVDIAKGYSYLLTLPKAGNNKSLTDFAFNVLDIPVLKKTPNDAPSLDKDVIEEYKDVLEGVQHDFIVNLSGSRKRTKSNEYLDVYALFGVPNADGMIVIHPSVNATGTDTTRLSMARPNLQQVSKQEMACEACLGDGCEACGGAGKDPHNVRNVFGPGPGREMWSMDAKNIELRIPAYESGEKKLIELFERPNDPPFYGSQHMLNLSIVYDDLWRAELKAVGIDKVGTHCKKKYASGPYHWVKCGGLAMQYQCGQARADATFRRPGYDKLKSFLGNLKVHNDRCVAFANERGYVETIPDRSLGMKRGYPLLCARGDFGRVKPTTPLNYRTQGTAGWWMVRAMNRCRDQLYAWHADDPAFDGFIMLTVHDELVFDFPKGKGKEPWKTNLPKIRKLKQLMEQSGVDIGVPTPVSIEYHANNWGEGKTIN